LRKTGRLGLQQKSYEKWAGEAGGKALDLGLQIARRMAERGPAFALVTTEPNDLVRPTHEKAMPVILPPAAHSPWQGGTADEARALIKPYEGRMTQQVATPRLE